MDIKKSNSKLTNLTQNEYDRLKSIILSGNFIVEERWYEKYFLVIITSILIIYITSAKFIF